MALSPAFCSDDFLTELEKELNNLDNALMRLSMESQEQKSELLNLSDLSMRLQNQLTDSQKEVISLREQSQTLKSQWEGLESSLRKSEIEMRSLRVKNWLLIGGISVTLVLSLVAVITVATK